MIFLFASVALASGLLFSNIYNSLVDAPSWGRAIPASIETARNYFALKNPGSFYRVFSPLSQVLALLVLILFWKTSPAVRLYLGTALLFYVLADVLTFAFFYPRNEILFKASVADVEHIRKAWREWSTMNWIRSLICLTGLVFSFLALHKIYMRS